jgi:hypothetical protein
MGVATAVKGSMLTSCTELPEIPYNPAGAAETYNNWSNSSIVKLTCWKATMRREK